MFNLCTISCNVCEESYHMVYFIKSIFIPFRKVKFINYKKIAYIKVNEGKWCQNWLFCLKNGFKLSCGGAYFWPENCYPRSA